MNQRVRGCRDLALLCGLVGGWLIRCSGVKSSTDGGWGAGGAGLPGVRRGSVRGGGLLVMHLPGGRSGKAAATAGGAGGAPLGSRVGRGPGPGRESALCVPVMSAAPLISGKCAKFRWFFGALSRDQRIHRALATTNETKRPPLPTPRPSPSREATGAPAPTSSSAPPPSRIRELSAANAPDAGPTRPHPAANRGTPAPHRRRRRFSPQNTGLANRRQGRTADPGLRSRT